MVMVSPLSKKKPVLFTSTGDFRIRRGVFPRECMEGEGKNQFYLPMVLWSLRNQINPQHERDPILILEIALIVSHKKSSGSNSKAIT